MRGLRMIVAAAVGFMTLLGLLTAAAIAETVNPGDILVVDQGQPGLVRHYSASGNDLGLFASGLDSPAWITTDSSGHIWVSEFEGGRVDKFSASGALLQSITTPFAPGDVAVTGDGTILVADYFGGNIYAYSASGTPLGLFASTEMLRADFMALDVHGNLYVTDFNTGISRISPSGEDLGFFVTGLGAEGIAFDATGDVYVANSSTSIVQKYSPLGADLGVFATGGYGLAFDPDGNLYSSANITGDIRKFSPSGTDLGGFGLGGRDLVVYSVPVRVPAPGTLVLLCSGLIGAVTLAWWKKRSIRRRIRIAVWVVVLSESISSLMASEVLAYSIFVTSQQAVAQIDSGTGQQTILSSGGFLVAPLGIAVSPSGEVFVADPGADRIIGIDPVTGTQRVVGGFVLDPIGIAVSSSGQLVVAGPSAATLVGLDPFSGLQTTLSSGGNLSAPFGVAIAPDGDILVLDLTAFPNPKGPAGAVIRVDPESGVQEVVSSAGFFGRATGIAVAPSGDIFIADDAFGGQVFRIDLATGAQALVTTGGMFTEPLTLAIAPNGTDILVIDRDFVDPIRDGRGAIVHVDPLTGAQTLVSSAGLLVQPFGIAIAAVPEPPTIVVVGLGLGCLYILLRASARGTRNKVRTSPVARP
jgi:DNA-binding beta-propeller fold protein YncE